MTYNAYEKGFLPSSGGIDDQPYLLVPLMATISSAMNEEDDLERQLSAKRRKMAKNSQAPGNGGPGYSPIGVPGKRGK
jgi:hypothetical protein